MKVVVTCTYEIELEDCYDDDQAVRLGKELFLEATKIDNSAIEDENFAYLALQIQVEREEIIL